MDNAVENFVHYVLLLAGFFVVVAAIFRALAS
jgi:hypothetical protein